MGKITVQELNAAYGQGNYAGGGEETIIQHGLGRRPKIFDARPAGNSQGYLGETWIDADETTITVGNTGSYQGEFNWFAFV